MNVDDVVTKIINLPISGMHEKSTSLYNLIKATGYFEVFDQINENLIINALNHNPECINEWLQYSADKGTNSDWYFLLNKKQKYVVGYFSSDMGNISVKEYFEVVPACASFIKKEIDWVDFIQEDNPFKNILSILLNRVKGFANSIECKELDDEDKVLNYVVIGAFNRYFEQLIRGNKQGILKENENHDLESCYNFLDELANSEHPNGTTLLTDGIFDYFLHGEISDIIYARINGKTKHLLEHWRKTQ